MWPSRIIGFTNGAIFAYWCGLGSNSPDWWLWAKFMIVSGLGFIAGELYGKAKMRQWQNSQ